MTTPLDPVPPAGVELSGRALAPTGRTARYLWERPVGRRGGGTPEVLAALRRGIGREPGEVPPMWSFYRELNHHGHLTHRLRAEHVALALFGLHQHTRRDPVHRPGIPIGTAVARLRAPTRAGRHAVDRRFAAFATASSLTEAGIHLRSLIVRLRALPEGHLDYTLLFGDLVDWQDPALTGRVRRRWGRGCFAPESG
jgi:CRISPR system Cascade subunit CasB